MAKFPWKSVAAATAVIALSAYAWPQSGPAGPMGMHGAMHQQMMQAGFPATLPDRLDLREKMLSAHLDALKTFRAAVEPL